MPNHKIPKSYIKRARAKGAVLHTCWKCGVEFLGGQKPTLLPAKKIRRHICPRCKQRMGLA